MTRADRERDFDSEYTIYRRFSSELLTRADWYCDLLTFVVHNGVLKEAA